ncbi:MAG: hypothetical protein U5K54_02605 [Cytophagales bacterium]|nr:hypothetical protein [Cytophagales bacterium]
MVQAFTLDFTMAIITQSIITMEESSGSYVGIDGVLGLDYKFERSTY